MMVRSFNICMSRLTKLTSIIHRYKLSPLYPHDYSSDKTLTERALLTVLYEHGPDIALVSLVVI